MGKVGRERPLSLNPAIHQGITLPAIRAERKESSELTRSWITGLTGLIGVLIGLLAIILGHR